MSSVETGQMSAVETGQMIAAETFVLCQQKKAQVQPTPRGRPWPGPGAPSRVHNVGSVPNHGKWSESVPESTVWPDTKTK